MEGRELILSPPAGLDHGFRVSGLQGLGFRSILPWKPVWFRDYLDPKEPAFLGLLVMISVGSSGSR